MSYNISINNNSTGTIPSALLNTDHNCSFNINAGVAIYDFKSMLMSQWCAKDGS
jgi:hypothetical protein